MAGDGAKILGKPNPWAFAIRRTGRLPEAPWYEGNGTQHIYQQPDVNMGIPPPVQQYPFTRWLTTRNNRPVQRVDHLGARASYTGWGFPSTWFTLRLPLAQPDLQTALSRRTKPIIQKFAAAGGGQIRIPAVYVPTRPTGPGSYGGGGGI